MWKIRLAVIIAILVVVSAFVSPVLASNTASFTVTASGDVGLPLPPSDFIVTRISDTMVRVTWTPWAGSANTSIRVKYDSEPTSATDGYLLYYGPSDTVTDIYCNLDVMWSKQYYIGASENLTGGWSDYVYDYVESPNVAEIATQLGNLSTNMGNFGDFSQIMMAIVCFLPLVILSVLAFWKENHILFMLCFGIAMVTGFNAPNIISGEYETTNLGIAVGVLLFGYSLFCAGMAFRLMFWKEQRGEE